MNSCRTAFCVVGLGLVNGIIAQAQFPPRYLIKPLPSLGGSDCKAMAMNGVGQLVGTYRESGLFSATPVKISFLFEKERLWKLPMPDLGIVNALLPGGGPGLESRAGDINDRGTVVGWLRRPAPKARLSWEAVYWNWTNQTIHMLPAVKGKNSFAYGINAPGDIVGAFEDEKDRTRAFVFNPARTNRLTDIGTLGGNSATALAINDHGQITGVSTTKTGVEHAFMYDGTRMHSLGTIGGPMSRGNAINSHGEVAGVSQTRTGQFHAFLYRDGQMLDLGTLGGNFSYAYGIYGTQVVGRTEDKALNARAFLFDGRRMWDLNALIPPKSGWFLVEAMDVDFKGQILCMGRDSTGAIRPVLLKLK